MRYWSQEGTKTSCGNPEAQWNETIEAHTMHHLKVILDNQLMGKLNAEINYWTVTDKISHRTLPLAALQVT